jgi:hypothetical protein
LGFFHQAFQARFQPFFSLCGVNIENRGNKVSTAFGANVLGFLRR